MMLWKTRKIMNDKTLLTLKELCDYTGWGMTSARKAIKDKKFVVRFGNKIFIHKKLFDDYLEKCARHNIPIELN